MPPPDPIRVLVADDEPLARRGVRQLLAPHMDMLVVGESRNGPETTRALDALQPDLLFLDVRMPELDGFEVLQTKRKSEGPAVIFVTAHDQFAVRAFDAHAIDYLVKPLNVARFEQALTRVRERLRLLQSAALARTLTTQLDAERARHGLDRLVVSTPLNDLVIPVQDIDWIAADDYYARLHVGPKSYLLRESLNSLEKQLDPARFVRVHRAAIVQLDRVRALQNSHSGDQAVLRDGTRIPVSRRRRAVLDGLLRRR